MVARRPKAGVLVGSIVLVTVLLLTSALPLAGFLTGSSRGSTSGPVADRPLTPASSGVASAPSPRAAPIPQGGGETLNLLTNALTLGSIQYPVGLHPDAVAVDPKNGEVYVANFGSGTVAVVDPTTGLPTKFLPVGSGPSSLAYDSTDGDFFVGNALSADLTAIDASTNSVLLSYAASGGGPTALAADPLDNSVWVASSAGNSLAQVCGAGGGPPTGPCGQPGAPGSISWSQSGLAHPDGVLYHAGSVGYFSYAISSESGGGAAIWALTCFVGCGFGYGGSISGVSQPAGMAYDTATNNVYIANAGSGSVTVANISNGGIIVLESTIANVTVGSDPVAIAYDSWNGNLYVANNGSDNVTVIYGATNTVVGSVNVGVGPDAIAYDPSNGNLYVANWGSDNLTVFNASNYTNPRSFATDVRPLGLTFDSADGNLYIAENDANSIAEVNGATNQVVRTFRDPGPGSFGPGGKDPGPFGIVFDPVGGGLYVADSLLGGVTVFNASANGFSANNSAFVPTGAGAGAVAVDNATGTVFVANSLANTVTALSPDPTAVELPVGEDPVALAVDSGAGLVFVANALSDNISVISESSSGGILVNGSLTLSGSPTALAFDPANQVLYVSVLGSTTLTGGGVTLVEGVNVSSNLTMVVGGTVTLATPVSSLLTDTGAGVVLAGSPASDDLTVIRSTGLIVQGVVPLGATPVGLALDPSTGGVYATDAGSASLSIVSLVQFPIAFQETGLPAGTAWSVIFAGTSVSSTTAQIVFAEIDGVYPFEVPTVTPSASSPGAVFVPDPGTGFEAVNGSPPVTVPIQFQELTAYPVKLVTRGLPAGSIWAATLDNVTKTNTTWTSATGVKGLLTFYEPPGTVNLSLGPPSGYGVALITGTNDPNQTAGTVSGITTWTVVFGALRTYTFETSNLSSFDPYHGAAWSVSLVPALPHGGPSPQTNSSTGSTVGFVAPVGAAYKFTVSGPGFDYRLVPSHGTFRIPPVTKDPGPANKVVKFVPLTAREVFRPHGLPLGTGWTLTITGGSSPAIRYPFSEKSPGPGGIVLRLPEGTYDWSANATGFDAAVGSGTLTVGYPLVTHQVNVSFAATTTACFVFTENGVPVGSFVCNANANGVLVSFSQSASSVCATQFTLGGPIYGTPSPCPFAANQFGASWTGSPSGFIVTSCFWADSGVPVGSCVVPAPPNPNGFLFDLTAVSSVSWTVGGSPVGPPVPAPASGANGVELVL